MIAPELIQEVRRLLAEGNVSQRAIARITGISRGTVGAIASGRRPAHIPRRQTREEQDLSQPTGPPRRCPGCGGIVYMPCRLCRARTVKNNSAKQSIRSAPAQVKEPLGLNLTDEHRQRYEDVRRRRLVAERAMLRPVEQELPDVEDSAPDFGDSEFIEDPDFGNADFWDDLQATVT